jgi:glycosyltransferase involved in cell wall biosynthesis
VIVLAPDLSRNAMGRALVFADLLRGHRDVAIAGRRTAAIWPALEGRPEVGLHDLGPGPSGPTRAVRSAFRDATIIAIKPLFSTFGSALLGASKRLVLDIDDPELALMMADFRTLGRSMTRLDGLVMTSALMALRRSAQAITVSSSVLKSRYGGVVVPHARDEGQFEADRRDRLSARTRLGLGPDELLVVFVGTVRKHKGIELLASCADLIAPARIAFVGVDRPLRESPNVLTIPPVSYALAMDWVAAADVVAVPQLDSSIGRTQAPAKIVDALAMGRAIVASDLSPIRELVGTAGLLVRPGSRDDLADGLRTVVTDHDLRGRLEASARARYLERYTVARVRPTLLNVLESIRG